jgi:hypothetical protein
MKFASLPLVSSRDLTPSRFHAERREMHMVDCMPTEECCSQATSNRCSKIGGVSPVKQMRCHSKTWQWRVRRHAQKVVEDGIQVDHTRHAGISLHSASLSQSHGHGAHHSGVMAINCLED